MQRGKPRSMQSPRGQQQGCARHRVCEWLVHRLSPPDTKKPASGCSLRCRLRKRQEGLPGSSLSPARAMRGPACGCPGSLPAILSILEVSSTNSLRQTQKNRPRPPAPLSDSPTSPGIVGLIPEPNPRCARASLRLSGIAPGDPVEPGGLVHNLSPPDTKKPAKAGFFVSGGERGIRTLDRAFDPILP